MRRREWCRLLLMLSLIVGVVTMHSTVACHAAGDATVGSHVSQASAPTAGGPQYAATVEAMPSDMSHPVGIESVGLAVSAALSVEIVSAVEHRSSPHEPMSALHDLLHLCLAVLTGLLVLVAAVLLALLLMRRLRPSAPASARPVSGLRSPPPTSVRLAQLCVLRN
ncbi:hypothetical protein [Pseudonocardia pini]|uniref:hypothetical protein n=1 Tax=Pseudonocardia pini TaxID=2758030 RepID=UPI001FE914C6|nr:hypothetical protein [Pseudonocardia pini]